MLREAEHSVQMKIFNGEARLATDFERGNGYKKFRPGLLFIEEELLGLASEDVEARYRDLDTLHKFLWCKLPKLL